MTTKLLTEVERTILSNQVVILQGLIALRKNADNLTFDMHNHIKGTQEILAEDKAKGDAYEYAGFLYKATESNGGASVTMEALPGQSPNASKSRHLMNAAHQYLEDKKL